MIVRSGFEGTIKELSEMLKELDSDHSVQGIMVLTCDENQFTSSELDPVLKRCKKKLWGGIFPQVLLGENNYLKGSIVIGIRQQVKISVLRNISKINSDMSEELNIFKDEPCCNKTMFVFVDGLSSGIVAVKDSLFNNLGLMPNYIGGGAGSLSFQKKPCILTNEGLLEDAAVLALAEIGSSIGVAHGWKPISEALKITEVDRNRIISINWRPAFEVYRETVEKLSGESFAGKSFFDIAKGYPFGIIKMADEMIVRDPISVNSDQEIICIGEIPKNSFVYILNGNKASLIAGAAEALKLAEDSVDNKRDGGILFIDCISRVLFLEDDFQEELTTVHQHELLVGALSLGEIANTGKSYLEFYNKTAVVGMLEA